MKPHEPPFFGMAPAELRLTAACPSSPLQLREIASHLVQLQDALNELSEEHNAALTQSQEKQAQLEGELRAALQDKVRLRGLLRGPAARMRLSGCFW